MTVSGECALSLFLSEVYPHLMSDVFQGIDRLDEMGQNAGAIQLHSDPKVDISGDEALARGGCCHRKRR